MTIKLKVTPEHYDRIFSIDEQMYLADFTRKQLYEKMVQCVVGDDGEYLPVKEARDLFRAIPGGEFDDYARQFYKAISDAFVNPTSGGG